jgi:hypothetical protein
MRSKTSGTTNTKFSIAYQDGSSVTGPVIVDDIRLGDYVIPGASFGAAESVANMVNIEA